MRKFGAILAVALILGACATQKQTQYEDKTKGEKSAKAHVDIGVAYIEYGNPAASLDEANIALAAYSNYAPAYHLKGIAYLNLDQPKDAQKNFLLALKYSPDEPDFNNSYGWFLCDQGNVEEGLRHLTKALANPYYRYPTRIYTNMGYCYLNADNDSSAESAFIRALEASPDNALALYELAGIAYRSGNYMGARKYLIRLHQGNNISAASIWLGLRTERRLGNRSAEESYAAQLKGRFADSQEYQWMREGRYE